MEKIINVVASQQQIGEASIIYVVMKEDGEYSDYYKHEHGVYLYLELAKQKLLSCIDSHPYLKKVKHYPFYIREMILNMDVSQYKYIIHTYLEGEFISYELMEENCEVPIYNNSLDDYYKSDFWYNYNNSIILAKLLHDYGKMNKPDFCNLINQNLSQHVPQIAELVDSYYCRRRESN
jgi:hypothetical protein